MRTAFIDELISQAETGADVWLVTGDLGFSVLERFAAAFPDRYLNAGVAEQSMLGVSAGIASEGSVVFAYSIGNFPTFRALEQVRNDVAYRDLPVVVVSVGSGFSYGAHGSTHHAIEDLAVMRSMPRMRVVSPGDPDETRLALRALIQEPGPAYLRLGKAGERSVAASDPSFALGRPRRIREGGDAVILATGAILADANDAVDVLVARGLRVALYSVHTLRPFDPATLLDAVGRGVGVVTVEEHRAIGGLRSVVAEALLDAGAPTERVRSLAVPADLYQGTGSQAHLRQRTGIAPADIVAAVIALVD